jgi:hypothetical protein
VRAMVEMEKWAINAIKHLEIAKQFNDSNQAA